MKVLIQLENVHVVQLHFDKDLDAVTEKDAVEQHVAEVGGIAALKLVLAADHLERQRDATTHNCGEAVVTEALYNVAHHGCILAEDTTAQHVEHARLRDDAVIVFLDVVVHGLLVHSHRVLDATEF
eukprot:4789497-Prymnesium_polylepis.2